MPTLYNIVTGAYYPSVHPFDLIPDYQPGMPRQGDWLIDPVLPDCPRHYWTLAADGQSMVEMTDDEKAAVDATRAAQALTAAWAALRAERNRRLAACDWTQLSDAPGTEAQRTAWEAYRQALRDLPQGISDPAQVSWPIPPAQ